MPMLEMADKTKLCVKEWGTGDRVLVAAHGWPLTADSWDDVAVPLAQAGWRVVAYDRRGFGRSDQPVAGYDYATFTEDFAAVVDWTGASRVAVVGFSMGGGEVATFVGQHGDRVSHAVLISAVTPFMLKTPDNPDGVDASVFEDMHKKIVEDRPAFMQSFAGDFYGNGWLKKAVSQGVLDHFFAQAMQAGLKPTLDCVEAFGKTDFRAHLSAFTMPTLVIHGTEDKTVPIDPTGRAAAKAVPHAVLKEYDGAHGLLVTHREQVVADMKAFLGA